MVSQQASIKVEVSGLAPLTKGLKAVGDMDAPYLRQAWANVGEYFAEEIRHRGPGAMLVQAKGVRGKGTKLSAPVTIKWPGIRPMEFGDYYGHRGHKDSEYHAYPRGQRPKPIVGVIHGDLAVGATMAWAVTTVGDAVKAEWERLASSPE